MKIITNIKIQFFTKLLSERDIPGVAALVQKIMALSGPDREARVIEGANEKRVAKAAARRAAKLPVLVAVAQAYLNEHPGTASISPRALQGREGLTLYTITTLIREHREYLSAQGLVFASRACA